MTDQPLARHPRAGGDPDASHPQPQWIPACAGMAKRGVALLPLAALAACARAVSATVSHAPTSPGFLVGVWHGFIFPVAWLLSLFMPEVAIYAVPNQGGWYDFGYFVGIVFLGVGARHGGRTVYRTVYVRR